MESLLSLDYKGVLKHLSEIDVHNLQSLLVAQGAESKFQAVYLTNIYILNIFSPIIYQKAIHLRRGPYITETEKH